MIPNEAVEAAARAMWKPADPRETWDTEYPAHKVYMREQARAALEAAAPHLMAQLAKSLLEGMEAWAGDKEIGFLKGFIEAAEEAARK